MTCNVYDQTSGRDGYKHWSLKQQNQKEQNTMFFLLLAGE